MIFTEVYVPALDKKYDFKLNEDVAVSVIIEEITSLICQKEHCELNGYISELLLFRDSDSKVLSLSTTLYENDIKTGNKLILC